MVALFIFLLVPLTQMFESPSREGSVLGAVEVSIAPPPPVSPPPELHRLPSMPTLEQMELVLNPGTAADLSLELGLDLNFQTESADQLIDLFGFDQLDQVPSVTRYGRIHLQRCRVGGYVELLIFRAAETSSLCLSAAHDQKRTRCLRP